MSAIRILIADDHPVVREGLAKIIALYDDLELVGVAVDGADAIERAEQLHPDVVLMDVRMPDIDGVEATRRVRAGSPDTEVIVLSNYDEDQYVFDALGAGAKGYLLKDVSADALVDAIRAVARGESKLDGALMDRVVAQFQQLQHRDQPQPESLTPREHDVLEQLAAGCSNLEIAERLVVSEKTVKSHLTSIYRKLNVRDRSQAIVAALSTGLVTLGPPPTDDRSTSTSSRLPVSPDRPRRL